MEQWNKLVGMVKEFYIAFGQQEFLEKKITVDRMKLREKMFKEEQTEYEDAEKQNDIVEKLDAVCDMYYIHIGTLLEQNKGDVEKVASKIFFLEDERTKKIFKWETQNAFNTILALAFEEVHRSNMSKLGLDGKPIYREDGKIIKGPDYFPPNLKQFL
jgi:hypothetical protein|nr:MAG TPA: NTP-PPase-like protein [Caudoviricetes sp.]DAN51658.1 MAG TPA: NTP-PPase-like protein [Caudoviricetes sp.]